MPSSACLERGRDLGDADFQVEAGLGRHRLHDLGDGARLRRVAHHEVDRQPARDAGFLQQRLGLGEVALGHGKPRLIVGVLRVDPLVARHELAVEHDLVDRLAVDG